MTVRRSGFHRDADKDGAGPGATLDTPGGRAAAGAVLPSVQKVAITFSFAFIVTLQPPLPVQAPSHSRKFQPLAGVWLKLTVVPWLKGALQVPGQLIPAGELVTVPGPSSLTARVNVDVVPTVTATDAEGMPLAMTTRWLAPVSMLPLGGTWKWAVTATPGAIDELLGPKLRA